MKAFALCCVAAFALALPMAAAERYSLNSPDGKIRAQWVNAQKPGGRGGPQLTIGYNRKLVVTVFPGFAVDDTDIVQGASLIQAYSRGADSTYPVLFGKSNPVRNHFNELVLELRNEAAATKLKLVVRAYDDGVAFRYEIPQQTGVQNIEVTDEPCRFRIEGDPEMWPLYWDVYTTPHEGLYSHSRMSELQAGKLIDLPLLAQLTDNVSVAFTEAGLRNYAGLYLKTEGPGAERTLRCDLSPLPGQTKTKVRAALPMVTPWRVIFVGPNPGRFIESNLILNLNEPCAFDTSWIKFGKTTWYWWNGPYQESVDFKIGLNWETMKHYIDFCASNRITFHAVMSTPDDYPWYVQSQRGFGPGPDTDITRPRDGFPMEKVVDYSRAQGVGTRLWVHWRPLSEHLEDAFAQYEKWGIAGLMVDFLDRDDAEMVMFAEKVLQSAARHHLHIHFHGVWKPTGLQRTYPNLFNHEGVLNLEYLKWSDQCSPPHNLIVPFTRMLAGPMDYHLGGFRSVPREKFKPVSIKPNVLGTRCHHLAMYVVYENPMPMVSDAPTAYQNQPGFEFIRQVPTSWDETRVLQAQVGKLIVVARRKGSAWYLGAMTDWTGRTIEVPLSFLGRGIYQIEVWRDKKAEDPNELVHETKTARRGDHLVLELASGGGAAAQLTPAK